MRRKLVLCFPLLTASAIVLALFIGSCNIRGFKDKPYPTPRVVIDTPSGAQSGDVTLTYRLIEVDGTKSNIALYYSTGGGTTYLPATAKSGDGTANLAGAFWPGIRHTIVWDTTADRIGTQTCRVKIVATKSTTGLEGTPDATGDFQVENPGIPTISWVSKPEGTVRQVPLTFTWQLDTPSVPIANYYYGLDEDPPTSETSFTSVTIPAPSLGAHTFRIFAQSTAGLNSATLEATFTADNAAANQPPTVVITGGPTGVTPDSTPTFQYKGSDPDGAVVDYYVSIDITPPNIWTTDTSWTSPELANGPHTFYVIAQDNEGANSSVASRSFSVTAGPSVPEYSWTKRIGGSGDEFYQKFAADGFGNIYITGYFERTINFGNDWEIDDPRTSAGGDDIFLLKIENGGSYGWVRRIGNVENDRAQSIAVDSLGNIYITGSFRSSVDFAEDWGLNDIKTAAEDEFYIFITKVNSDGSYGWTKSIGAGMWGNGHGEGLAVTCDSNNHVFITGRHGGGINFADDWGGVDDKTPDGIYLDVFVTKINSDGNYGWTRIWGADSHDLGEAICIDSQGFVYVAGFFYGEVNFMKDWGGTDNRTSIPGSFDTDLFLTKLSNNGGYEWTKRIGNKFEEEVFDISADSSDNIYIGGAFWSNLNFADDWGLFDNRTAESRRDAFIMRVDNDGQYGWVRKFGAKEGTERAYGIAFDCSGNIIIAGTFEETVNFGEDWGLTDTKTASWIDGFITQISVSGGYLYTKQFGAELGCLCSDGMNNIFVGCTFTGTKNFGINWGLTDEKTSAGGWDLSITKLTSN